MEDKTDSATEKNDHISKVRSGIPVLREKSNSIGLWSVSFGTISAAATYLFYYKRNYVYIAFASTTILSALYLQHKANKEQFKDFNSYGGNRYQPATKDEQETS